MTSALLPLPLLLLLLVPGSQDPRTQLANWGNAALSCSAQLV